jgi:hypothetical protein
MKPPIRVVVWSTGGVGVNAIRAVAARRAARNRGNRRRRRARRAPTRCFARSLDFEPFLVNIEGDPDIECRLTLGPREGHDAGEAAMTATAMRVVNAIPAVVDAPAGLCSSLDLPVTVPHHVFG